MKPLFLCLVAVVATASATVRADPPSFDCAKAATPAETAICADENLSYLDWLLGGHYRQAQAALGDGAVCLRSDQRRWLREVRDRCTDAACLERAYYRRLDELDGLVPGASRFKALDDAPARLRSDARLVLAMAPAARPASGSDASVPFATEGRLCEDEGGYAIAETCEYGGDPQGLEGVLVSEPVHAVLEVHEWPDRTLRSLQALAHGPSGAAAKVRLRGWRDTRSDPPRFDRGRCIMVYSLDAAPVR